MATATYYEVLTAAINDIVKNGFVSAGQIEGWVEQLRAAAVRAMVPESKMEETLRDSLAAIYHKLVDRGGLARHHPGIGQFTLERIKPQLRAELDKRIMNSANLIKLNREQAIQKTLQRFQGWATSIPEGGAPKTAKKQSAKGDIKKALGSLPFEERRVLIDQGQKLNAAINEVVAKQGNALACIWHSHFRQAGYNYRKDHKERDGRVYLLRDSWALEKGLIKPGAAGYLDDITRPGEEVFCRCYAQYVYSLRDMPADMLTKKGAQALADARAKIKAMKAQ